MEKIRVGAAAIVMHEGKILLAKRNKDPNRGKYILPGGGVDMYESLESAVKREIMEEAGLELTSIQEFRHYELITPAVEHRIIFYFICEPKDISVLRSSDDITDAEFFTPDQVQKLIESGLVSDFVAKVLADFLKY